MRIQLESVDPWSPAIRLTLDRFPVIMGGHPQSDIYLPDRGISSPQCRMLWELGHLVVEDLQSQWGTLVNGVAVVRKILFPGDLLTVGIRLLRVTGATMAGSPGARMTGDLERRVMPAADADRM